MSDTCGGCSGDIEATPAPTANRPGLSQIAYRVGTHASFLAAMLARLTTHALPSAEGQAEGSRPLQRLTARASDDPAIALLDAWATLADVLTFYQERIANEGYLRTATERRSVLELGRLVGYRMRPGVAASVYLAYEMDVGVESDTEIPVGSRAQSVPGPGELPQSFETAGPIKARTRWNAIRPRQTRPQVLTRARFDLGGTLYLKGISTNLKPNGPFLLTFGDGPELYRIIKVTPEPLADRTALQLQPWIDSGETSTRATRLRELAKTYANLGQFDVEETRTAQELASDLTRLAIADGMSVTEVTRAFRDDLLPKLRTVLSDVQQRKFRRLSVWLGAAVEDISAAIQTTPGAEPAPASGLDGLVRELERRPARPPASPQQLDRDLKTAFRPGSESAATMIGALRPGIGATLYAGWASLPIGLAVPVEGYAFRAQAGMFGSNAPQKVTVPGTEGGQVSYDEWKLKLSSGPSFRVSFALEMSFSGYSYYYDSEETIHAIVYITIIEASIGTLRLLAPGYGQSISESHTTSLSGERVDLTLSHKPGYSTRNYELKVLFRDRGPSVPEGQDVPEYLIPHITITLNLDKGSVNFSGNQLIASHASADSTVPGEENENTPVLRSAISGVLPVVGNSEQTDVVTLDTPNVPILPDSYVVVERPASGVTTSRLVIARAMESKEVARADYGISGKGTQVLLDRPWLDQGDSFATLRGATVFAASEQLELAEEPVSDSICDGQIELDGLYDGLTSGRWLIVAGERAIEGVSGVQAAELVMIASVRHGPDDERGSLPPGEQPHTTISLAGPLSYCYRRSTMKIYANVAPATHGETRREILGAGDGSKSLQSFTLRFAPLTYVPAANPSGVESSLEVYVNDVRWHEAPALAGLGPRDRRFVTRQDNDHNTTVTFGSGHCGARLPTGRENVRAVYRNGIGKAGNVAAGAISLLATRPLGVRGVTNPLAASGGADPESRDQARANLPLAVTALDRLVSVQDYEDFTRTFAGIGKARAYRLDINRRPLVHITIAGADDIPISPGSSLLRGLREALVRYGDPALGIQIALRERVALVISMNVSIDPDHLWEKVEPTLRARLLERFSFDKRALGQDALLSEVIAVAHAVPGVCYVDVDSFGGVPELVADADAEGGRRIRTPDEFAAAVLAIAATDPPQQRVRAATTLAEQPADGGPANISPAQIALLLPAAPDTLILRRIAL